MVQNIDMGWVRSMVMDTLNLRILEVSLENE
jgi:hypothetical protein